MFDAQTSLYSPSSILYGSIACLKSLSGHISDLQPRTILSWNQIFQIDNYRSK